MSDLYYRALLSIKTLFEDSVVSKEEKIDCMNSLTEEIQNFTTLLHGELAAESYPETKKEEVDEDDEEGLFGAVYF